MAYPFNGADTEGRSESAVAGVAFRLGAAHFWSSGRLRMTKLITTLSIIALATISCSCSVTQVQTLPLPSPNPTSFSFPLPLAEIHTKALEAFSIEHQIDQPIFGRSDLATPLEDTLSAECATNAVFGQAAFRDPANAQDIYLHTFHMPFVLSSVYRGKDGGLPFIATFHLHLAASGSNTVVTITASDTEIVTRTKFGFGPCGPGQGYVYESVKPTTVEEYSILRYVGSYIGVTNMPEVIKPKL